MDAIKFGSFVASVRKEKNMTQAELAAKNTGNRQSSKPLGKRFRIPGYKHIGTIV